MYDVTFTEMIVGYLVFSSIYILLAAVYFRYKRKKKQKNPVLTVENEPPLTQETSEPFSKIQKEYLAEIAGVIAKEVANIVFDRIEAEYLNSTATAETPSAPPSFDGIMTEEELLSEPILPIGDVGMEIDSGHSVYYDEMDNLANVMRGEQLPYREQMAAYHTVRKMMNTELFDQMMGKIEGAKQNLTTVFSTMASTYNDHTSENPYKVYENVDYLPVKRK